MTGTDGSGSRTRGAWVGVLKGVLLWGGALVVLVLVIAWLSGWFVEKTLPGEDHAKPTYSAPADLLTVVERRSLPSELRVVGSVQAVDSVTLSARVTASVKRVLVSPGERVEEGDVLVELDSADLEARRAQSEAALDAAEGQLAQAVSDRDKLATLVETDAATPREYEDAKRAVTVAEAEVRRAREGLRETEAMLSYATIRSPMTGMVIDTLVDPGDLARVDKPLVTMEGRLQLVASVPESVAMDLSLGDEVGVEIDAIGLRCEGRVSEIIAQASPLSRSFMVKVSGPCPPGVFSGMFGRMILPYGEASRLLLPRTAVRRVGQLEMVYRASGGSTDSAATQPGERVALVQHFVRSAPFDEERVEVLSGLQSGDRVLADASKVEVGHE